MPDFNLQAVLDRTPPLDKGGKHDGPSPDDAARISELILALSETFSLRDGAREDFLATLEPSAIEALQRPDATVETCLSALFVSPPPALAREVCAALLQAERQASPARCETFNIEGAVGVPNESGADRLWLGLRSPLVEGHAVLLRLAEPTPTASFRPAPPGKSRFSRLTH